MSIVKMLYAKKTKRDILVILDKYKGFSVILTCPAVRCHVLTSPYRHSIVLNAFGWNGERQDPPNRKRSTGWSIIKFSEFMISFSSSLLDDSGPGSLENSMDVQ